jgi:hypothetical protein
VAIIFEEFLAGMILGRGQRALRRASVGRL